MSPSAATLLASCFGPWWNILQQQRAATTVRLCPTRLFQLSALSHSPRPRTATLCTFCAPQLPSAMTLHMLLGCQARFWHLTAHQHRASLRGKGIRGKGMLFEMHCAQNCWAADFKGYPTRAMLILASLGVC